MKKKKQRHAFQAPKLPSSLQTGVHITDAFTGERKFFGRGRKTDKKLSSFDTVQERNYDAWVDKMMGWDKRKR